MAERTLAHEKIEPLWDSAVDEILADEDGKARAVQVTNLKSGETKEVECKGVFIAIGHLPNTQPFREVLPLDDNGYLIPESGSSV